MIRNVEMINWRAFENRKISFDPGITFLLGTNGSGKTSVLEAISYGMTGEVALFTSKTRPKLLRNPDLKATVNLVFETANKQYAINRSQSPKAAADAELKQLMDGKLLASNQFQCTQQISKLMGVSAEFLRRIVYMSEGDVFRFINEPPGDAMETQIKQVLGLIQLDQFTDALDKSQKKLKQRVDSIKKLSTDLSRLKINTQNDLQCYLDAGKKSQELLLKKLENNKEEILRVERIISGNQRIQDYVMKIKNSGGKINFENEPLLKFLSDLEYSIKDLFDKRQNILLQKARLEGEKQAQARIVSVLEPYVNLNEMLPCPVCKKPISDTERHLILSDFQENHQNLEQQIEQFVHNEINITKKLEEIQIHFEKLNELRRLMVQENHLEINDSSTFQQIIDKVLMHSEEQEMLLRLEDQRKDIQYQLNALQTQFAEYLAIQKRLSDSGFKNPEEVNEALIALEVRLLSIRSAALASQKTLVKQRNVDMKAIYTQIAQVWGAFTGEDKWEFSLDAAGLPILENKLGRNLDLYQLSGGEKTALLIMLHTVIAHNFSRSDFILIDEPLEHLDPIHRRSLIHFLLQGYQKGMFKQAIVATFEETLIRKYLSEEGVNMILV